MKQILSLMRKELEIYFGSLLVIIFMGAFLAVTLFAFFNIDTFFARGIADIRPMFNWMPILLIFLLAAITMRQWSEEQRSGTLELLLTLPLSPIQLVLGKFFAVMVIISVALAFTLPLPITVSFLGPLDWGPVVGGYVAALLMASAYAAIGLFISSRTDNQIVALISTVLLGGVFYLVGTSGVTNFFPRQVSEILWALGTGSRFESIERGVIDLRDLVFYLSLAGIFLVFNTISLDSKRWNSKQVSYRQKYITTTALITLNILLLNVWLYPLQGLRLDLTQQKEYTTSQVTKDMLANLQEPLLIRGYFSEKTHPLLAPLVPSIQDMLREYQIAGKGMVEVEVVDPLKDPDIEAEANQTYGITATPFQVMGKNEASVINSYFNILIRYGDQSVILGYEDIVEIIQSADGIETRLKNLEYSLTSSIKKVVFGFQSVDAVLAALDNPVYLTLYITPDTLPESLANGETVITEVARQIEAESNGKFAYQVINPDDPNSGVTRQTLTDEIGLQPFAASLFSEDTYFFHMILQNQDKYQLLYPPQNINQAEVRTALETALKRSSTGFLKVVGIWSPSEAPTQDMFGQTQQPITTYQVIRQQLSQEYTVQNIDLSTGTPPEGIDVLVVVAPQNMGDLEMYAIDQYLMRGGSVIIAVTNYKPDVDPIQGALILTPIQAGINPLLEHYGVSISPEMVLDSQSDAFPVVTTRDVSGVSVQEVVAVQYPFFIDIRNDGMDMKSPILSGLPAVTLNWVSPVQLDAEKTANQETHVLLQSSSDSWLTMDLNIQPDFDLYPDLGFPVDQATLKRYPLAVSIQGSFESYFKGLGSPAEAMSGTPTPAPAGPVEPGESQPYQATVDRSPDTSRLVVIGSAEFADDFVLNLASRLSQDRVQNNLRFLQNAVSWSAEDLDLLSIRGRGAATRLLNPLGEDEQTFWEVMNYILAFILLVGFYAFWQIRKNNVKPILLPESSKQE